MMRFVGQFLNPATFLKMIIFYHREVRRTNFKIHFFSEELYFIEIMLYNFGQLYYSFE